MKRWSALPVGHTRGPAGQTANCERYNSAEEHKTGKKASISFFNPDPPYEVVTKMGI